MGYCYCGYCGTRGHNKLSCPVRKEEGRKNPGSYLARQLAREKTIREETIASRCCSYCRGKGHNRRGCKVLKLDENTIIRHQVEFQKKIKDEMAESGLGVASLVHIPRGADGTPWEKSVMVMVTNVNWQGIDFLLDTADTAILRNAHRYHRATVVETRVVSTPGYSEEDNRDRYWSRTPEVGSVFWLKAPHLQGILKSINVLSKHDTERNPELALEARAQVVSGVYKPWDIDCKTPITDSLNDLFQLYPHKRSKDWEKTRVHRDNEVWSRLYPEGCDDSPVRPMPATNTRG